MEDIYKKKKDKYKLKAKRFLLTFSIQIPTGKYLPNLSNPYIYTYLIFHTTTQKFNLYSPYSRFVTRQYIHLTDSNRNKIVHRIEVI